VRFSEKKQVMDLLAGEALATRETNSRSLHYAPPDFLWNLVASANFMRLSLRRGAFAVLSSAAWQEIRVRSGRDDNLFVIRTFPHPLRELQIPRLRSG
jgi:hypothetical protein